MAKTFIDDNERRIMPSPKSARKGPRRKRSTSEKHSFESTSNSSTFSRDDNSGRKSGSGHRTEVAASIRKFTDDEDDYLANITKSGTRKKSSKKGSNQQTRNGSESPKRGRKKLPAIDKPKRRSSHINENGNNIEELNYGETTLNDEAASKNILLSPESCNNARRSAKKLFERAVRAASPGRLRRARSKSPGKMKTSMRIKDEEPVTSSPKRPKSSGRLKKIAEKDSSVELEPTTTKTKPESSSRAKKRSQSPGRLKKRSEGAGRVKKRSQSPGRLRKSTRSRRRESSVLEDDATQQGPLGTMLDRDAETLPKKKGNRSVASAPTRKSKSTRPDTKKHQSSRLSNRVSEDDDGEGVQSSESSEYVAPKPERSYSNMQDELNRYKVKRNKSMDAAMAMAAARSNSSSGTAGNTEDQPKIGIRRAASMRLTREMGRRGKQESLVDLIQYKEEEIHSTSYFASNHVLINRERMKRGLRPLCRNIAMDELARKSAEAMAASNGLNPLATTYVGNVCRGESIRSIHRSIMLQKQGRERQNLLNPYFQDFGVGTCKGEDGQLYMCQLFSERLELSLTDTSDVKKDEE